MHLYQCEPTGSAEGQAYKSEPMNALERLRQTFVVTTKSSESREPPEASFNDPSTRQQYRTSLGLGKFDNLKINTVGLGILSGLFACASLVDVSNLDVLARSLLNGLRQFLDLGSILFISGGYSQGQQMAKGVDGYVYLGSLLALVSISSGACPTFRSRLHGSAIQYRRCRNLRSGTGHP